MDERQRRWERRFEWPLVIAALLTIPALVLEESPIGEPGHSIALAINWVTWTAFAVELVVMLWIVHARRRWLVRHPIDVAVVVLSPPFLPAALQWARFLRVFRVLPLFRAHALRRILSLEGIRYATLVVGIIILAGGTSFAAIEGNGLTAWDGVWFAVETVTTVGYGDIVPSTSAGRVVAMIIMFVGIGFVALLTGFVADRFINRPRLDEDADERGEILRAQADQRAARPARARRALAQPPQSAATASAIGVSPASRSNALRALAGSSRHATSVAATSSRGIRPYRSRLSAASTMPVPGSSVRPPGRTIV